MGKISERADDLMGKTPGRSSGLTGEIQGKINDLLESGKVNAVLVWQRGDLPYDVAPMLFKASDTMKDIIYNRFCGSNLSKYLVEHSKNHDKILVFLKPCDTYSLNQLLSEQRVDREKLYIIGVGCNGMIDIEAVRGKGFKGILDILEDGELLRIETMYGEGVCSPEEVLLEKCVNCKGKDHMVYDELMGLELSKETASMDRFAKVVELEDMSSDERFAFWRGALSKCIRCNACRNVCPACTCLKCVFDNPSSGVDTKVNTTEFEENMFHIIRAFHVTGRCSDCGECTRVCPQGVPLQLLNRKMIKDINLFYGEYQAGETDQPSSPLLTFDYGDVEPNVISKREEDR